MRDVATGIGWDSHRLESQARMELGAGADAAEGVTSFLEKRPPEFTTPLGDGPTVAGVPRWPAPPDDLSGVDPAA